LHLTWTARDISVSNVRTPHSPPVAFLVANVLVLIDFKII
jgi:hypothetical protein